MSHRSKRDYVECGLARVERYKAVHKPRCNGGDGCNRCWHKWHIVHARGGQDDRPAGSPGATLRRRPNNGSKGERMTDAHSHGNGGM